MQGIAEILVKPISPLVCGIKNEKGNYVYLSPEDERFVPTFIYSWREKFKSIYGEEECSHVFNDVQVEVVYDKLPPKSRLITIKAETPNETKIRGFVNYSIKLTADVKAFHLLHQVPHTQFCRVKRLFFQ